MTDGSRHLARAVTGLSASGDTLPAAYRQDRVRCARCATALRAGDRVSVLLRDSADGWRPVAFRCPDHAPDGLASLTSVHGDDQALVAATLEPTGGHTPTGQFDPEALTLGGVEVVETAGGDRTAGES
ncbi:MAG: hypothetical protein J07HB67_02613 [halophilic archaeon J07HB67]|nr:MAG: hypothetical protein J07HB67_02613 [halophilic archaeon J07HB67]